MQCSAGQKLHRHALLTFFILSTNPARNLVVSLYVLPSIAHLQTQQSTTNGGTPREAHSSTIVSEIPRHRGAGAAERNAAARHHISTLTHFSMEDLLQITSM